MRRLIQAVMVFGVVGLEWTAVRVVQVVWPVDWWDAIVVALGFVLLGSQILALAFAEVTWTRT